MAAGSIISTIQQVTSFVPFWFLAAWLLAVTLIRALYQAYKDPLSKIPGPWFSRWTGLVETSYYVRGYRHLYVHSLHEKYGSSLRHALVLVLVMRTQGTDMEK
jgi:hypothetical protein